MVRPAVAFVNKYGMTFVLDRETGKPLIPIKEVKVPQSSAPDVNTWPTQPVPMADNVLFNKLNAQGLPVHRRHRQPDQRVRPVRVGHCARRQAVQDRLRYDPYDTTQYVVFAVRDDGLAR